MKKMKILFAFMMFAVVGMVSAENIPVADIVAKFQQNSSYSVTNKADGSEFTVNTGATSFNYRYSQTDNVLTYNYSPGVELSNVISSDDVLAYIVELSSNAQAYKDAKAAHPEVTTVSYGNGCDLTNMGFCYNSGTGEMKVVLSNQFTTYLYNYYSNGGNVPANTINDDNTKNSVDPVVVEETTGDAKNPNTGSFTEIGIIVGLLALLVIVINLKKRSETEFKI